MDHQDLFFGYDCGQVHKLIDVYVFSDLPMDVLAKILRWLKFKQQIGEMEEVTNLGNSKTREIVPNWGLDCRILHFPALDLGFHLSIEVIVSGWK